MSDFRSQFRATSIKALKKVVDKDNANLGVQSDEYLQLEDKKTLKIRIFPAHPGQEAFYVSKKCYWLPFPTKDGDVKRRTVLDSVAHGGTKLDIVQEYVKLAKKRHANDSAKVEALVGTGPKANSLNPQYTWICYADVISEGEALSAKLWEFKKMVRDGLNKLSFSEDEDEPIEVDPFTDVDEGLPVLVKYLKNPDKKKGENFYEVSFAKKPVARPLTDEELDAFSKMKPLNEVVPLYSITDFDRALEGLQQFDEDNEMGMFEDDEWLEIVEQVKAQYDASDDDEQPKKKTTKKVVEEDDDEEEKPAPKKKATKNVEPEEEEEESDEEEEESDTDGDEFDEMDRSALKKYIVANSLEITVKKSMTDDDIRNAIRNAKSTEEAEEPEEEEAEEETTKKSEAKAEKEEAEEEAPKSKVSLADIRAKLAGGKK